MLYEGALSSVDLAIEMLHTNDVMARGRAITKAVDILGELHASLRDGPQPEYTSTLAELYGYMQNRLLQAHARKSEPGLVEVSRLLKCLYEAWLGVMRNLAKAPADSEHPMTAPNLVPASPYETYQESAASSRTWQI